jgi:phosphoglycerate dehydrogenase-like enzyme
VIVTPQSAHYTVESNQDLKRRVADTACRVAKGEIVYNIVNKQLKK